MERELTLALTLLVTTLLFLARNIWEMDRLLHLSKAVKGSIERLSILYFHVANLNEFIVSQVRIHEGKVVDGDEHPAWRKPRRGTYGGEAI